MHAKIPKAYLVQSMSLSKLSVALPCDYKGFSPSYQENYRHFSAVGKFLFLKLIKTTKSNHFSSKGNKFLTHADGALM